MNTTMSQKLVKSLSFRWFQWSLWQPRSSYHVTNPVFHGGFWRRKQGLPCNPNAQGPLTDLPDYTFLDGRRTPVGSGKLKRYKEQAIISDKIIRYSQEMDQKVHNYERKLEKKELWKQSILDRKLKPKGDRDREVQSQSHGAANQRLTEIDIKS